MFDPIDVDLWTVVETRVQGLKGACLIIAYPHDLIRAKKLAAVLSGRFRAAGMKLR